MALRYLNSQRAPSIYHNILSILFIHVSKSITIMIRMGIPNRRRMRRPYSFFLFPSSFISPSVSSGFSVVINL